MEALAPHHSLINETARADVCVPTPLQQAPERNETAAPPVPRIRQRQQQNRQWRRERYDIAMEKVREGLSQREIARDCGLSLKTVRCWIRAGQFPERKRGLRHSSVEAHREFLERH